MKNISRKTCIALASVIFIPAVYAQEQLAISDADIARMGIIFAPVAQVSENSGARFPATVINSPDSVGSVSTRYSGRISDWQRSAGESVKAGDILLEIQSQEIVAMQNEWMASATELTSAEFELTKDRQLFEQGVIAQQRFKRTEAQHRQAAFAEQAARVQLNHAGFDAAKLQALRSSGAHLGVYYVTAPVDAVLTQRLGAVGEFVDSNAPIASLNSGDSRWVSIHVPARIAENALVGQQLTLVGTGESLTLRQKDFTVDSSNQSVELFAAFNGPSDAVTGQVVSVILPPSGAGILVPDRAVVHTGNDTTVYVQTPGGVEARNLMLRSIGGDYLAETGVSAGERVVIQGTSVLKGIQLGLGGGE